tara:strand:+ start:24 stop:884 length:861 start_codon:yes stop_codon:yes gene_type:complete
MEKLLYRKKDEIGFGLLALSSFLILFVTANEQSLWLDEVATVSYSDPRVGFSYNELPMQLPLIYVMIFISRVLLGSYEIAYRLPILILSMTSTFSIPIILKREGVNQTVVWLAPYLILLSPQFIYYAQKVRTWMPMAACLILWGTFRDVPGLKGWILCSIALQSNYFAVIYVFAVVSVDWVDAWLKRNRYPSLAPVVALITHIPSISILLYKNGLLQIYTSKQMGVDIGHIVSRFFHFDKTTGYLKKTFIFLLKDRQLSGQSFRFYQLYAYSGKLHLTNGFGSGLA